MGNEIAQEVPQVQMVEVLKQTAAANAQRIVQTGVQYERAVQREVVLDRAEVGIASGIYEAPVIGVRENALVQPTVVERVSPIMTTEMIAQPGYEVLQPGYTEVIQPGYTEVIAAPTMVETMVAPTVVETFAA